VEDRLTALEEEAEDRMALEEALAAAEEEEEDPALT
jgi:hypothetical protein